MSKLGTNIFLILTTSNYSRVPNTTVGNLYSFFGACPSYMALFGTSRLLNFKKSSFLHFYSELIAYWFFTCTTLQLKVFVWSKSLLMNIWFLTLKNDCFCFISMTTSSPFIWDIIHFCNMDGFFWILEKIISKLICKPLK